MDAMKAFRIHCISFVICAAIMAIIAWHVMPVGADVWVAVICFAALAALAETQSVAVSSEGSAVTPTGPIFWAAAALLPPFAAAMICVCSAILSNGAAFLAFRSARILKSSLPVEWGGSKNSHMSGSGQDDNSSPSRKATIVSAIILTLERAGAPWEWLATLRPSSAILHEAQYASAGVMSTAFAGLVYHWLGGHYLATDLPKQTMQHFVGPFIALVAAAVAVDHTSHIVEETVMNPIPGAKGIYGVLLKMRLVLLEDSLPLARAEVFFAVVSLLLAYLYGRVGVMGFLFTAMPVMALRDFYHNWVTERSAYLDTITTLATYMQHYHPYTRGHLKRVADMSERLARELRLPVESIRFISHAGLLHDIGKIGVSEEILDKTSKLDPEEWEKIKEHPIKGAEIISHLDFLEGIVNWIKFHHKWYDGRGYPTTDGAAIDIPIEAAIIAVADSFDAMTDDRELSLEWTCDSCGYKPEDGERPEVCPICGATKGRTYREPKTLDAAIDELRKGAGSQFHPHVVKAFLAMVERDGVHLNAN